MTKAYVNTDGSAVRPEPGPAGAGYVILYRGAEGWDTIVGAVPLRPVTHHEAEYEAAILALTRAAQLGATSVVLGTDSRLLVDQMNKRASVVAPQLIRPHKRLNRRVERFDGTVTFVHVDRKHNKAADKLAGFARKESESKFG